MEHKVRPVIVRCLIPIDQQHPVSPVILHQAGRRIYGKAGSGNDQHIRVTDRRNTLLNSSLIQLLFIQDHIRLYNAATIAAWHI